ncbi:MAG: glycoside hydrolase family 127 protein [Sedimentisphaerales bacterium]|nr:glycoside hydrolase family 127 protein [Sedimentisphaerales bacterium]
MKDAKPFNFIVSLFILSAISLLYASVALSNSSVQTESSVNLALITEPSSSRVSGDTSLSALNDDSAPNTSHVRGKGSYGNWPARGTQWVQYDWSKPISTQKIDVYWWDDRRGVRLPAACRLLYWDGKAFVPVKNALGLGVEKDRFNTTTFEEVSTSRLRLEIDSDGQYSTGILEWKVYDSGNSPDFPPVVQAGVDRVVIQGGRTWLNGTVKTLRGDSVPVVWSKISGPGNVAFAKADSVETTATFSEPGTYVLNLAAGKAPLQGSSKLTVNVNAPPPATHLHPVDTIRYKIDSPLWSKRAKALIVNWIPHCITKIADPEVREGGINNFIDAAKKLAGQEHGPHRGYVFSNAWVYNTIESICVALMVDPQGDKEITNAQNQMRATLEDWIPKILAAQEPDGYLQTAFTLSNRRRWSPEFRGDHEGYVAGYFLECAVSHYLLTNGKDARLYDAAKKLADCWCDNIGPAPKKEWYDGHQAMEIALVRFGRFVNDREGRGRGDKYIALAKFLLDCRRDGSEYDQSHVPVVRQYEAVGHAVRASYSYAGMADVAMETGDVDYLSATMSLWDNMVHRKYYVTGGIGSGETSEGFGPDYSLPHDAYCESCSSCGLIFMQHKLNMIWHDARYADLYEETLYNALLGSIDLEGKNFYYQNPLDSRQNRYDWHGCPCCVGNIPRTLLMLPTWMYSKSDNGLYVNLFAGSTVQVGKVAGTDVEMVQSTDYPWSGDVQITVNPASETNFDIYIRMPNRSVSDLYTASPVSDGLSSIKINGNKAAPAMQNGYAVLHRTWKAGDRIALTLPMKIQRIKGIDKIEATRDRVALRCGPLLYSFERVDQNLDNILPSDIPLKTEWKPELLEGVIVIRGSWADGSDLMAIPNYARNNRSFIEQGDRRGRGLLSSVWMKDR